MGSLCHSSRPVDTSSDAMYGPVFASVSWTFWLSATKTWPLSIAGEPTRFTSAPTPSLSEGIVWGPADQTVAPVTASSATTQPVAFVAITQPPATTGVV